MGYTIQDILLYLKVTVIQTGYQMLKTQNPIVVVFTLRGAKISWKQMIITRSMMEFKFIALDKCGEVAGWLCHFLEDIPRWPKPVPPICIHCNIQSTIGRAQNSM